MRCTHVAWWMLLFGAFGIGVPGCFWFGTDDESHVEGRICASPREGGEYCVAASEGPEAAWYQAEVHGDLPIQMWAEWPKHFESWHVVANPRRLEAWLDDVQTIMTYLRHEQGNAESYHASLEGKLGDNLLHARKMQEGIIKHELSVDPKKRLERVLLDAATRETDPLKAELTADKQTMGEVQTIVDQAQVAGAPFAAQYKGLVDDFLSYRATEAAETLTYTQWSHEASAAGLEELESVEEAIVDFSHTASAAPHELLVAGMKLSAQILQFENASREALAPHGEFMANHNASVPDSSSGALRSIHAMLGYVQQRVTRSDATAKQLVRGAALRRRALQLLSNAPSPLRATTAQMLLAQASTQFAGMAQVRVQAMGTKTLSQKLGLPALAVRHDEFAAVLQMVPLCNASSSSWREAGCAALRPKFKEATHYLKVTLPAEIMHGLSAMKNQGMDAAVIEKVEKKLQAGDIKGAALAHDALLSSLEGT